MKRLSILFFILFSSHLLISQRINNSEYSTTSINIIVPFTFNEMISEDKLIEEMTDYITEKTNEAFSINDATIELSQG